MVNLSKLISVLFILLLVQTVFAASVSDFDKLISMYDSKHCKECHDDITPGWLHSSHSKSLVNSEVLKAINSKITKTAKTKRRAEVKLCFSCHAPQISSASESLIDHISNLIVTARDAKNADKKNKAYETLSQLSLNCRICHMMKGMPDNRSKTNTIWGPGWDEHEQSHTDQYGFETLKSEYLTSAQFCKSCHNGYAHQFTGPDKVGSPVKCVKTIDAPKTCQDCHDATDHSFSIQ